MKIKIIWGILLCCFISILTPAHAATIPSAVSNIIPSNQLYKKIASLKIKDVQKLTGRKLTIKEKIGFLVLKHKLKHPPKEGSKQGQTALTFGIIALALLVAGLFVPYVIIGSLIASILAIVSGSSALRQDKDDRKAYTGKLLGWITLGVIALFLILAVALISSWGW